MSKFKVIHNSIELKPSDFDLKVGDTVLFMFYDNRTICKSKSFSRRYSIIDENHIDFYVGDKLKGVLLECKFQKDKKQNTIGIWDFILFSENHYYFPPFTSGAVTIPVMPIPSKVVLIEKRIRY